jgi:putative endonuclease
MERMRAGPAAAQRIADAEAVRGSDGYVLTEREAAMEWCVYVLRCGDGSFYTGMTNDLSRRLEEHRAGRGGRYTRAHLPVRLVAAWSFDDRGAALSAEAFFKKLRRSDKARIIRERAPFRAAPFAAELLREARA